MDITEKKEKLKWTWGDIGALLTVIGIVGLVIYFVTNTIMFFYDLRDEDNYNYQFESSDIISYDMKIKKSNSFLSKDDYNIYVENEYGQTKILSYINLYVEKGDKNKLVVVQTNTKKNKNVGTDYVFFLDKDNYASFNREFAKTFNKETNSFYNKDILEKAIIN